MKPCADCIIAELDVFELVQAIGHHAAEVKKWLRKPPMKDDGFLVGPDRRLVDFDPLDSLQKAVRIIADAQRKAEKTCKSMRRS